MLQENLARMHTLGHDTAQRLHGGMGGGGMTDKETMAAVRKVKLRVKPGSDEEKAFYKGAEHYCMKNCTPHVEDTNLLPRINRILGREKLQEAVDETGHRRYQVLAGGQDSGLAGAVFDNPDDAWKNGRELAKHPQYKNSNIHVHDRVTGHLHNVRTGRISSLKVGRSAYDIGD